MGDRAVSQSPAALAGQEQSGVPAEPAASLLGPPVLEGLDLFLGEAALPWPLVRLGSALGPDADEDVQLPAGPQPTSCVDHEALVIDERQDVAADDEIQRGGLQLGRDRVRVDVVDAVTQPAFGALPSSGLDRRRMRSPGPARRTPSERAAC